MKKITVACIGTTNHELMKFSIDTTLQNLPDVEDVLVASDRPVLDHGRYVELPKSFNLGDYQRFLIKELIDHVKTEFVLVVQYDGMAVNKKLWTDDFYNYDYIGAAWPDRFVSDPDIKVGNGGFSLRSAKLLTALQDSNIDTNGNEDAIICQRYATYLRERHNIKFAPVGLADQFSNEWNNPSGNTFGFHGAFNVPLYFDEDVVYNYINLLPVHAWPEDQIYTIVDLCHRKNYVKSLNRIKEKLELRNLIYVAPANK